MLAMIRSLFQHQAWADVAIWKAVRAQPGAGEEETMRRTLYHIVVVQRAFLSLFLNRPFDVEKELQMPASLDEMERLFHQAHGEQIAFVAALDEAGLSRRLEMPWIPGARPSVAEALFQVVMHSQSHRGQCAARLRALGGTPPATDFILWVKDHPAVR